MERYDVSLLYPGLASKGRTIRKVKGGGGGVGVGDFQLVRFFFFFWRTACAGIFFPGETPCTNFFRQIWLFLTVKS